MCVNTCVSILGFKSILHFILFSIIHCGKIECAPLIVGCLPSICSPPNCPIVPDFHFGTWGSRDVDSVPSSISCHCSAGKPLIDPFLIQSKKPKSSHWAARLDTVWLVNPISSPTVPPTPIPLHWPLAFLYIGQAHSHPQASLMLICQGTSH